MRDNRDRFWASEPPAPGAVAPAEMLSRDVASSCLPRPAVHLSILPNVKLVIEEVEWERISQTQLKELSGAIAALAATLARLGLAPGEGTQIARKKEKPRHNNQVE